LKSVDEEGWKKDQFDTDRVRNEEVLL